MLDPSTIIMDMSSISERRQEGANGALVAPQSCPTYERDAVDFAVKSCVDAARQHHANESVPPVGRRAE
jgi:hypothetical protein